MEQTGFDTSSYGQGNKTSATGDLAGIKKSTQNKTPSTYGQGPSGQPLNQLGANEPYGGNNAGIVYNSNTPV